MIRINKDKDIIDFRELPRNVLHALELAVEWHGVLLYEIKKGMYGFTVLESDMYIPPDFSGFIESKYIVRDYYIPIHIQNIIDTQFKGIRCMYFPKGFLEIGPMELDSDKVCPFHRGYGFSIEVHSHDYGFLDSDIAPAHAHVLDREGFEIGMISITGPCPKKVSDIKEFRPPQDIFGYPKIVKVTPLMKHRKNIIKWANSCILSGGQTEWEKTKKFWTEIHCGKSRSVEKWQ
jgi:hypothetical protein